MTKQVIKVLGENEKNDKLEEMLSKPLIIGEPEQATKEKGPEDRKYLLLYYASDEKGEEDIKSFEFLTGRTKTYEFIKNIIENIDIYKSKVIVETVTLNEMVTVYEFMKHISSLIEDTSFDIEDYNYGDIEEI